MFSIFEFVILFFQNIAILECFDVIHEEIMQIGKTRHLKISEDLEKMKNEDSRGLGRRYKMRKTIHKFQDILYGSKHPKRRKKIGVTWPRQHHMPLTHVIVRPSTC